jgi:UDP-N-acetylmuramoyl-tripeptide--D-alanyl-D-alanine ligase
MTTALDPRAWIETLEPLGLLSIAPDAQPATAITWDSREVNADTAFAALIGETTHGNQFVQQALEAGAPFVLTDLGVPRAVRVTDATRALRGWARAWRDTSQAQMIGVTGSAGKTTLREYLSAALGVPRNAFNTLNAIACYQLSHVQPATTHVMEMGIDRLGEMNELVALVNPDFGVVTSIGPAHLEFFGSLEKIAFEKGQIFADRPGIVGEGAAAYFPERESYGFGAGVTHRGLDLELTDAHARFTYHGFEVGIPNPSAKVAEAALGALVIAQKFGAPLKEAASRLADVDVPGGRMRIERSAPVGGTFTLIDDAYNANPLSVNVALDVLERQPGRRVAVLGDMREVGPESPRYHAEIGTRAGSIAQVVIGVGEYAGVLTDAARESGATTHAFPNAKDAVNTILETIQPGDTVLVKGSLSVGLKVVVEAIRAHMGRVA